MKTILAIAALGFAIVVGFSLSQPLAQRWEDSNRYKRQAEQLQLERQRFDFETYATRQNATLPGKIAADYGLIILLGVGAAGLIWMARDSYIQRRAPLVKYPGGYLVPRHLV